MIRYFMFALRWIIFSWFLKLSHFCRTCNRYHKQDSSVVKTVSKDSQQRNQRFQRFYTYRGNSTTKHNSPAHTMRRARHTPAGSEGITNRSPPARRGIWATPCPMPWGSELSARNKKAFSCTPPRHSAKKWPPTLSKPQKIFQFQKEPFKQLGSMLYLSQDKKGGIKNGQSRYCSHACGFCS